MRYRLLMVGMIGIGLLVILTMGMATARGDVIVCETKNITTSNTTFEIDWCTVSGGGRKRVNETFGINTTLGEQLTVTNIGAERGSLSITLSINGTSEVNVTRTLAPNTSTELFLETNITEPGIYNVSLTELRSQTELISRTVDVADVPYCRPLGRLLGPLVARDCPNDLDDDGLYADFNGNGKANFNDAIDLVFYDLDSLPPKYWDLDGDGDVDFDDIVEFAFRI